MERTRLVLERKSGQSLFVGDARIQVELKGSRVKLIIEAPKETRIVREELRTRAA